MQNKLLFLTHGNFLTFVLKQLSTTQRQNFVNKCFTTFVMKNWKLLFTNSWKQKSNSEKYKKNSSNFYQTVSWSKNSSQSVFVSLGTLSSIKLWSLRLCNVVYVSRFLLSVFALQSLFNLSLLTWFWWW